METLFSIANTSVLPCWLLLILAPRWRVTHLICGLAIPLALGSLYAWLLKDGLGDGGFGNLDQVMKLFQQPRAVFAGWVHYLIFDLFIGGWETRDAMRLEIPRWALLPCQILTFLLGPIGLLLYLVMRGVWKGKWEPGV